MKIRFPKIRLINRVFPTILAVGLLVSIGIAAVPTTTVMAFAYQEDPPISNEQDGEFEHKKLVLMFRRLNRITDRQTRLIERAEQIMLPKIEDRLDHLKDGGKDIASLEDGLEQLKDKIDLAKRNNELSLDLIERHPGFDSDGKVENMSLAEETVSSLREFISEARKTIREGIREFRQNVQDYKETDS